MRRLWGRLEEWEFRKNHGQDLKHDHPLWVKITRCSHWTPGSTASSVGLRVKKLEQDYKVQRLQQWRARLRGSETATFQWLRSKPQRFQHDMFNDTVESSAQASSSMHEALENFSFWDQVWQRSAMPEEVPADEYLNQWQVPPAISSTWAPVEFRHVMNAVHKQHHKSAGVDGYSGSEVAAWPVVMWSAVMMVYHTFERLQAMPSNWQCIRQTHLPKASLPLGSIPVSKLRPISVMSVFWRIYISAKLQGRDALDWYRTQLSEHQWGSRKKRDAAAAVVTLAEANSKGHVMASLDFSQAFDRVRPERVLTILTRKGFPQWLASVVASIWGNQKRVLQWAGCSRREVVAVNSSMPQGDSLAPWALNVMLQIPCDIIQQLQPRLTQVLYLDDRSFVTTEVNDLFQTWNQWRRHAAQLGMSENLRKTQFFCKNQTKQNSMLQHPDMSPHVTDCLEVLGICFTRGNTEPTPKESGRVARAVDAAHKVRAAPFKGAVRHFFAQSTVGTKATFGWLLRSPPQKLILPCQRLLKWAGFGHKMAAVPLQQLLLGHTQNLSYMAGQAAVSALWRAMKIMNRALDDWNRSGGVTCRVKRFLADLGWTVYVPFCWQHRALDLTCDLRHHVEMPVEALLHNVRETWRHATWHQFISAARKDSHLFRNTPYDAQRCKAASRAATGAHEVAVLTGAFVSPARYSVMQQGAVSNLCHRGCGCVGHFLHVAWECPLLNPLNLPVPRDDLQRYLGWPTSRSDVACLKHLVRVRKQVLDLRWRGAMTTWAVRLHMAASFRVARLCRFLLDDERAQWISRNSSLDALTCNGSASDSRSEGWEFESLWPHLFPFCSLYVHTH